jgi:hypothetical protein
MRADTTYSSPRPTLPPRGECAHPGKPEGPSTAPCLRYALGARIGAVIEPGEQVARPAGPAGTAGGNSFRYVFGARSAEIDTKTRR